MQLASTLIFCIYIIVSYYFIRKYRFAYIKVVYSAINGLVMQTQDIKPSRPSKLQKVSVSSSRGTARLGTCGPGKLLSASAGSAPVVNSASAFGSFGIDYALWRHLLFAMSIEVDGI